QHLWIDWNAEIEGIKGAYVPAWIDQWRRPHGLVVGLTGMATGAGITWLVRAVSSKLIGQETMGLGDVTLMAMIGCFLGWQPVLFVFLLAPLCGITLSLAQRFLGGKTYLPFGPFLALATLIVLLTWKWLWMPLRYVFGHPPSLAILLGGASVAFIVLLILARLYRAIPVDSDIRYSKPESDSPQI
ncbi:MAG TPA: A24 family peptidase, partial [Planctomycetaceae bacterium]|nr:A24 family peptidase [Planctomycetaceae bacterium]